EFYKEVKVPGNANEMNPELEKAGRVADFLELGELFAKDALMREESCGGHFREESVELDGEQKGEAKRNDTDYAFVAAWEYKGEPSDAVLHKEELELKDIELKQRSYKKAKAKRKRKEERGKKKEERRKRKEERRKKKDS